MNKKTYDTIKSCVDSGVYKMVRLIKPNGKKEPDIIVPYNKVSGNTASGAIERLNYIRLKLDQLPPGIYIIQCRVSHTNSNIQDTYTVEVMEKKVTTYHVEDKTEEQETDMEQISLQDHIDLIKENATLAAMNQLLTQDRDYWKKRHDELAAKPLGDSPGMPGVKSPWEMGFEALGDSLPPIIGILDKFLNLQEQKYSLDTLKLNKKVNPKPTIQKSTRNLQQEAEVLFKQLDPLDENALNTELDALQVKDPKLYDLVCGMLGILEDDGDEEQEDENLEEEGIY